MFFKDAFRFFASNINWLSSFISDIPPKEISTQVIDSRVPNLFIIDDLPAEVLGEILACWAEIDTEAPWVATLVGFLQCKFEPS